MSTVAIDAITAGSVYPSVVTDRSGRVHVVYYPGGGTLRYATCASLCIAASSWQVATIDTGLGYAQSDYRTSIGVDATGRVHVAYLDGVSGASSIDLTMYATCAQRCGSAAHWSRVPIDSDGAEPVLAAAASGSVSLFFKSTGWAYATCASGCDTLLNWHRATVDTGGLKDWTSIALDPAGGAHVAYLRMEFWAQLRYGACVTACDNAAAWQTTALPESVDFHSNPVLAAGSDGRLHLALNGSTYATCASVCTNAASWRVLSVDSTSFPVYAALAVSGDRVALAHSDLYDGGLRLATCSGNCVVRRSWTTQLVDPASAVGLGAVAIDGSGTIRVVYVANGRLIYAE